MHDMQYSKFNREARITHIPHGGFVSLGFWKVIHSMGKKDKEGLMP